MVKKRLAMRMVTIFVALIVCGMFFPNPARGVTGDDLSSENWEVGDDAYIVKFKDLKLDEESSIPVEITNKSDKILKLLPQFKSDGKCELGFTYTGPWMIGVEPEKSLFLNFTYTPTNYEECEATLDIADMLNVDPETNKMAIVATITVIGVLEEPGEEPRTLGKIVIGDVTTMVDDRMADAENSVGDMIQECVDTAYTPGHLVRCVGLLARELWREQILSSQDRRDLTRAAIKSDMRRMFRKMRAAKRSGRRGHNSKHWRWHHWHYPHHR